MPANVLIVLKYFCLLFASYYIACWFLEVLKSNENSSLKMCFVLFLFYVVFWQKHP